MEPIYDQIGDSYTRHRCADHRIASSLADMLGISPPATIADIGAGTGNYSRAIGDLGFQVQAIEPSEAMRSQATPHDAVQWTAGTAEHIPLPDNSINAVLCILASHHFASLSSAIAEISRICRSGPIIWFTFDPREADAPWIADYFPTIWTGAFSAFPPVADVCDLFERHARRHTEVITWSVPYDLHDCFVAAGWRRPQMYLDRAARAGMSAFALADAEVVNQGLSRLQHDLETGQWESIYGELLSRDMVDWGYRLLRAE